MSRISKDLIEAIGILALVASLIFVGLELRQSRAVALTEATQAEAALVLEAEGIVLAHADVWQRGCSGQPLNPDEALVFDHLFHTYESLYLMRWIAAGADIGFAEQNYAVLIMAYNLHRNAGLMSAWNRRYAWRPDVDGDLDNVLSQWQVAVEAKLENLRKTEPVPLQIPERCGLN